MQEREGVNRMMGDRQERRRDEAEGLGTGSRERIEWTV